MKDALFCTAVFVVDADQKLFDILSARVTVGWTGILADRKLHEIAETPDIPFFDEHQRADDREIRLLKMSDWWESIESSLVDQRHHGSLDQIILMMSIGDLVTAESQCLIV